MRYWIIILLIIGNIWADTYFTDIVSLDDGEEYEYQASRKDFLKKSKYDPRIDGNPPLSSSEAYKIAYAALSKVVKNPKRYSLREIVLVEEYVKDKTMKKGVSCWYWSVRFTNNSRTGSGFKDAGGILIFQDGTTPALKKLKD